MVANALVKSASLEFKLFRNMYLAGTLHFIAPQLLVLTLIKGTIIFGGGPVSSLILYTHLSVLRINGFPLDSYDVISDSHLRSVYSIGSHPSLERIRRSARLRFSKRFPDWFSYHTSISRTQLQL
jgi:hypothetical protein